MGWYNIRFRGLFCGVILLGFWALQVCDRRGSGLGVGLFARRLVGVV